MLATNPSWVKSFRSCPCGTQTAAFRTKKVDAEPCVHYHPVLSRKPFSPNMEFMMSLCFLEDRPPMFLQRHHLSSIVQGTCSIDTSKTQADDSKGASPIAEASMNAVLPKPGRAFHLDYTCCISYNYCISKSVLICVVGPETVYSRWQEIC